MSRLRVRIFVRVPFLLPLRTERFEDICLTASGVRCAVLLDSRRAPRASPPLADVVRALQHQYRGEGTNAHDVCDYDCDGNDSNDDIASLGLLRLQDSCFLVNRFMLRQRLDSFHSDDFALIDVNKKRNKPVLSTDELARRLHDTLIFVFGSTRPSERQDAAMTIDDAKSSGIVSAGEMAAPLPPNTRDSGGRHDRAGSTGLPNEGASRWLRDWSMTETSLDGTSLDESLGDVGLPGLAGWILEYPVIYCCPSREEPDGRQIGRGDETSGVGNCLAMVPLTVFSFCVELSRDAFVSGRGSKPQYCFEAFCFSVPETVRSSCEAASHSTYAEGADSGVARNLQSLVNVFAEKIKRRMARHGLSGSTCSAGCHRRNQHWLAKLDVSKRTETLDRVAL